MDSGRLFSDTSELNHDKGSLGSRYFEDHISRANLILREAKKPITESLFKNLGILSFGLFAGMPYFIVAKKGAHILFPHVSSKFIGYCGWTARSVDGTYFMFNLVKQITDTFNKKDELAIANFNKNIFILLLSIVFGALISFAQIYILMKENKGAGFLFYFNIFISILEVFGHRFFGFNRFFKYLFNESTNFLEWFLLKTNFLEEGFYGIAYYEIRRRLRYVLDDDIRLQNYGALRENNSEIIEIEALMIDEFDLEEDKVDRTSWRRARIAPDCFFKDENQIIARVDDVDSRKFYRLLAYFYRYPFSKKQCYHPTTQGASLLVACCAAVVGALLELYLSLYSLSAIHFSTHYTTMLSIASAIAKYCLLQYILEKSFTAILHAATVPQRHFLHLLPILLFAPIAVFAYSSNVFMVDETMKGNVDANVYSLTMYMYLVVHSMELSSIFGHLLPKGYQWLVERFGSQGTRTHLTNKFIMYEARGLLSELPNSAFTDIRAFHNYFYSYGSAEGTEDGVVIPMIKSKVKAGMQRFSVLAEKSSCKKPITDGSDDNQSEGEAERKDGEYYQHLELAVADHLALQMRET